ncbi:MAG TPA: PAS domain S-box protein [Alphaproteobacteria bacterium]|nr:PAS domain S-box protein [Alphaproteobacteria bacterium]
MDTAKAGAGRNLPPILADGPTLLAAIVESSDDAIVSKTLDGTITSWNAGAERIFGYTAEEMIGDSIYRIVPLDRRDEEKSILGHIAAGKRIHHFETLRRHKDGHLVPISLTISPIRNADGVVVGASKIARDISDRKRLEEAQRLLIREVNHRSKNLLSIVQSIVRYTVTHSPERDVIRRINERLQALSANQDLLVASNWRGVEIAQLVLQQLGQVERLPLERVSRAGPAMILVPTAAQALGLALHELATNALKFGALSVAGGRVAIGWEVIANREDGSELVVTWRESGGPAVVAPAHAGFGTTIIERITGQSMGGQVVTTYALSGLTWELRAPAGSLIVPAVVAPAPAAGPAGVTAGAAPIGAANPP